MDCHQGTYYKREFNTVHDIKTKQGFMAYLIRSQKKETNLISNERSIGHDGRPYRNSPISKLVPGEKIPCVTQGQGKDEKANSDHPIKLSRRPVGACVEDPYHMEEDRHHHPMSGPPMQISQNLAVENKGKGLHIEV
jgi:hypothetical protein